MKLHQSGEDYIKTILLLQKQSHEVRNVDIAEAMGYAKPSVSHMIKNLKQLHYVTVIGNNVCLTADGLQYANKIYVRYRTIRDLLIYLGVSPQTAEKDACRIEHMISDETFEALKNQLTKKGEMINGVFADSTINKGL
ncbi:metal-dependent transcriptional regulator [[Clostridium] fimetarium]|uniref:metal-dependent transcriptional regulator n=1 Tax=[Clostridium] fimetarium TaxID=99656 RepID=UPI00111358C4|nr:metal-dependent transcriptional regulator [[Clostridium] fimetarium]